MFLGKSLTTVRQMFFREVSRGYEMKNYSFLEGVVMELYYVGIVGFYKAKIKFSTI